MSSSTPSPDNPWKTPAAKKKEDYEDYDLSPPKMPKKQRLAFDDAVKAINNDFKELRVEWKDEESGRAVLWLKRRDDDTEVELPRDFRRILLFLYSRSFKKNVGKDNRMQEIKRLLNDRRIRKIILQVMKCTGDRSLSHDVSYQHHYIRACLTIHRYFQQTGANGFVSDMSSTTYYLRMQKFGSCFLQAPCVAMSYLLQAHGAPCPPPNASRLIRHHFDDEQLIKYINDLGGDSVGIFKILEEKYFEGQMRMRGPSTISCRDLRRPNLYEGALDLLRDGPGLVSKFEVPKNFVCSPPSNDLKEKWPELASYKNWDEIPAHLIPPGVARFTVRDKPAEFIPLDAPSEAGLKENEHVLEEKWKELLRQFAAQDDGQSSTAVTASMSVESSSSFADNETSLETPRERSPAGTPPRFKFTHNEDSDGEDWSHFLNDDDDESFEDQNVPGEGSTSSLHAMVLLGHRKVEGSSGYWLLQNSWEGPMQFLEVSNEYLIESGAYLYFYDMDNRSPKPKDQWEMVSSSSFCPSPVAESSLLERSDCENWNDDLVHSVQREEEPDMKEESDFDDWSI